LLNLQLACPGLFPSIGFYFNFGTTPEAGHAAPGCPKPGLLGPGVNPSVVVELLFFIQSNIILNKNFVKGLQFAPARNFKIASSRVIEQFSSLLTIIFKFSVRLSVKIVL